MMASQESCGTLNDWVREAIAHRQWRGTHENPSLGKAVVYVEARLLPGARRALQQDADDSSPDAENLVADVGCEAIRQFHLFTGTTGGEFYRWMRAMCRQSIAREKRLREAREKGVAWRGMSLERAAEGARLVELLVSPDIAPEEAATLHENADRVQRAMRGLSPDEIRVARLRADGYSFRDIAAVFGRSASWAHDVWEAAAHHLRANLKSSARRARRDVSLQLA